MTIKELKSKEKTLWDELTSDSSTKKRRFQIINELKVVKREIDKLEGKTYTNDKWITSFIGNGNSYKEARLDLVNQIKDLSGVEVSETDGQVTLVTVYTEYKIYRFVIHAHNFVEPIHTGKYTKDLWNDDVEIIDYKHIVQATIDKDEAYNWVWRY